MEDSDRGLSPRLLALVVGDYVITKVPCSPIEQRRLVIRRQCVGSNPTTEPWRLYVYWTSNA